MGSAAGQSETAARDRRHGLTGAAKVPDLPVKHDLITVVQGTVECFLCRKGVPIKEAGTIEHAYSDIKVFVHMDCARANPERACALFNRALQRIFQEQK